jgi:phospholipid/cholesterol/gamma-HCH transport system permease protein
MHNGIFTRAGHQAVVFIDYMGNVTLFFAEACCSLRHRPYFLGEVVAQMYYLGVKTFFLVAIASFAVGLVLGMQTLGVLSWFGGANYIAPTVGFTMTREMGPLMAAVMMAARGGAGIGAELGSMRVTHQIDALTVSAVNPMKFLVVTRILACMFTLPLLAICADMIGILGGMVVGVTQLGQSPATYLDLTIKFLHLRDVLPAIFKTIFFGLILGTISCYHGYTTTQGTFGVGQATKTSVVASILLILVSDVVLTKITLFFWP